MNFKYLFLLLLPVFLAAQGTVDRELSSNRGRLNELRREISQLRGQLADMQKKAHSVQDQLQLIEKQMGLIAQSKGLLLKQQQLLEKRARQNREELINTRKTLKRLKTLYADRMRYMYKYGRIKELEAVLTSESLNQAFVRLRYLNRIADYDKKTIQSIEKKQRRIEKLQQQMAADLKEKQRSLQQKRLEEQIFAQKRRERNKLLAQIEKDSRFYKRQIDLKEKERKRLSGLIAALEQKRKARDMERRETNEPPPIDFDDFKKGRGKLPWPVRGKVVSNYGKDYDPKTKTYVTNSGIEISSAIGTPVKCVFTGVVSLITYMSGYGNTIIIDHGHGYYTVYSHLGEIYVQKGDVVDGNQIIALIGDSGSLAGSKLHFEIYAGNKASNPRLWLR